MSRQGSVLGELVGVTDGRVDINGNAPMRGSGSLTWVGTVDSQPDWEQVQVQPVYRARTRAGTITWPLGVFIPAVPAVEYNGNLVTLNVELYDRSLLLTNTTVSQTYSVPAGTVVTTLVRTLLTNIVGGVGALVSVVDSTDTLRTAMTWDVGTTILRIVNDLLGAINYFSVWADGRGVYRAEPYRAPGYRAVEWAFQDDKEGIYLPKIKRDQDRFRVPNRIILVGQSDGTVPALVGIYENRNDADPRSIDNYGYSDYVETGVEATTQAVIDALALRKWQDLSKPAAHLTLDHAMLPLDPNDVVTFRHRSGLNTLAVLQSYTVTTKPGSLANAVYLEVAS